MVRPRHGGPPRRGGDAAVEPRSTARSTPGCSTAAGSGQAADNDGGPDTDETRGADSDDEPISRWLDSTQEGPSAETEMLQWSLARPPRTATTPDARPQPPGRGTPTAASTQADPAGHADNDPFNLRDHLPEILHNRQTAEDLTRALDRIRGAMPDTEITLSVNQLREAIEGVGGPALTAEQTREILRARQAPDLTSTDKPGGQITLRRRDPRP
jgi:hypothetical protein